MTKIRKSAPLLLAPLAFAVPGWTQCELDPIRADQSMPLMEFGNQCALSDGMAVVTDPGTQGMRVWTFERQGAVWLQRDLRSGFSGGPLGGGVSISGSTLMVGSTSYPSPSSPYGAAVSFEWTGASWSETQVLVPSPGVQHDMFGFRVAVEGDRALVSAPGYGGGANDLFGAVFVYERSAGTWAEVEVLRADDPDFPAGFGQAIALLGDRALVGAVGEQAAYVFEAGPSGWSRIARLEDPLPGPGSFFGASVALGDGFALVADPLEDVAANDAGAVYAYEETPGGWVRVGLLAEPDPGLGRQFGRGLALDGDVLLAGAPAPSVNSEPLVSQFVRGASGWLPVAQYAAAAAAPLEHTEFGWSIGSDDGVALIGAPKLDGPNGQPLDLGAVHELRVQHDIRPYCACAAAAPCGNADAHAGCANSTGAGGWLLVCGTPSIAADDLALGARRLPASQSALLFAGTQAVAGGAGVVFGDGLRCAGVGVLRLGTETTDASGAVSFGPGVAGLGGWSAGDLRYFQVWYRDPAAGPCGSGFNLTNALEILFGV